MSDALLSRPSLLPPNATEVERAIEQAVRLDLPVQVGALWSPDLCPPGLLGHLAWSLSLDVWRDEWPEAVKRQMLAASLRVHARAGTPSAVRDVLASLNFAADIVEWWQAGGSGQPYTCRIDCFADEVIGAGGVVEPGLVIQLRELVAATAPARVHFTVRVGERFRADTFLRAAVAERMADRATLEPVPRLHRADATIAVRAAVRERAVWTLSHDCLRSAA